MNSADSRNNKQCNAIKAKNSNLAYQEPQVLTNHSSPDSPTLAWAEEGGRVGLVVLDTVMERRTTLVILESVIPVSVFLVWAEQGV